MATVEELELEFNRLPPDNAKTTFAFYKKVWAFRKGKIHPDLGQSLVMLAGQQQDEYIDLVSDWKEAKR